MGIAKRTRKFAQTKRVIGRRDNRLQAKLTKTTSDTTKKSVRNKIDIIPALMDLLLAKCIPVVTDCSIGELEKLGPKYRLALRVAKDERFERLRCSHSGTYADDCIISTVTKHRCYLVGTNDRELKQKLRRIPGVPLIAVGRGRYYVERLPEASG
ncbi:rRNA-processing protein FCF1-like protein [Colletotrichum viniferum]|nr:rRNA-processing protein FCF1-like protein [Colletotrichum viniferum]